MVINTIPHNTRRSPILKWLSKRFSTPNIIILFEYRRITVVRSMSSFFVIVVVCKSDRRRTRRLHHQAKICLNEKKSYNSAIRDDHSSAETRKCRRTKPRDVRSACVARTLFALAYFVFRVEFSLDENMMSSNKMYVLASYPCLYTLTLSRRRRVVALLFFSRSILILRFSVAWFTRATVIFFF